jgi:hypothetical protein
VYNWKNRWYNKAIAKQLGDKMSLITLVAFLLVLKIVAELSLNKTPQKQTRKVLGMCVLVCMAIGLMKVVGLEDFYSFLKYVIPMSCVVAYSAAKHLNQLRVETELRLIMDAYL